MFEIGWSEILVIAVVAIVVIGPKDLPRVMRTVGQWTGKVKRMGREFQNQFNEALREAELEGVRKDIQDIMATDPLKDVKAEMGKVEAGLKDDLGRPGAAMAPLAASAPAEPSAPAHSRRRRSSSTGASAFHLTPTNTSMSLNCPMRSSSTLRPMPPLSQNARATRSESAATSRLWTHKVRNKRHRATLGQWPARLVIHNFLQ